MFFSYSPLLLLYLFSIEMIYAPICKYFSKPNVCILYRQLNASGFIKMFIKTHKIPYKMYCPYAALGGSYKLLLLIVVC